MRGIYSSTNFQTFVENGGVPAYIYHLTKTDAFGNVTTTKVINFSNAYMSATGAYVNYNVFDSLYNRKMAAPVLVQTQPIANLEFISNGDAADLELGDYNICYTINSTEIIVDLEYKNYFYFEGQAPKYIELFKLDNNVSIDKQSEILSGQSETYKPVGFIQLKLSAGFSTDVTDENNKINKPNEWTLLDYIYLYEYARGASNLNFGYDENDNLVIQENVASNVFYGLTFENLVNGGNYIDVYSDDEGNDKFIALNGTVYNVAPYVRQVDTTNIDFLKNFNDKINSYITNNETGNVSQMCLQLK